MYGTRLARGILGFALLGGAPSVGVAAEIYDRKLERAVMDIVAANMKVEIRGTLSKDWRPPTSAETLEVASPLSVKSSTSHVYRHSSIIDFDRAAIAAGSLRSVQSFLDLSQSARSVRIIYF